MCMYVLQHIMKYDYIANQYAMTCTNNNDNNNHNTNDNDNNNNNHNI